MSLRRKRGGVNALPRPPAPCRELARRPAAAFHQKPFFRAR
jgi:hypothetical protein